MPMADAVSYFVDFENIPDTAGPPPDWARPNPDLTEQRQNIQRMFRDDKDSSKTEEEKRSAAEKRREMVQQIQRAGVPRPAGDAL